MINHDTILWHGEEAAMLAGGRNTAPWHATGLALSVQDIKPGDLFFADARDDLALVFAKGAACAVVTPQSGNPDNAPGPLMIVPDVYASLRALARAARFRTHTLVVSVQGREAKHAMAAMLETQGRVYQSGRHLSMSLAALPVESDYAVFGLSSAVAPDIAVITDGQSVTSDVFESMPAHGIVLIADNGPGYVHALALARAAGIRTIFSFGDKNGCDARMTGYIESGPDTRLAMDILGEKIIAVMPAHIQSSQAAQSICLAAALIAKITGASLSSMGSMSRKETILRVAKMIDCGGARRMAILDTGSSALAHMPFLPGRDFSLPARVRNLSLIHTARSIPAVGDIQSALMKGRTGHTFEPIVPEVLRPGDFMVFRGGWNAAPTTFSQALRLSPGGPAEKRTA